MFLCPPQGRVSLAVQKLIHSEDQADIKLPEIHLPVSASQGLELKMCDTTTKLEHCILIFMRFVLFLFVTENTGRHTKLLKIKCTNTV